MSLVERNETLKVRGILDITSGTINLSDGTLSRTVLAQEDLVQTGADLATVFVWNDLTSRLSTAGTDNLGIVTGTWNTDSPTLQTSDQKANGAATAQYGRFFLPLPDNYVLGADLQIRFRAGMITTVSDTTATIDLECYVNDGDGGVGSELCATAAQSINSLTKANFDFALTTTALVRGDVLDCRVAVTINDGATATAVKGEISKIALLSDIKG